MLAFGEISQFFDEDEEKFLIAAARFCHSLTEG